jgi:hypothetical protein
MQTGIGFSIIKAGPLLELRIEASNGVFSARADVYDSLDALHELATKLKGFPIDPSDVRIFETGMIDVECGGGATLRFYCLDSDHPDSAGHYAIEVRLRADPYVSGPQEARFGVLVEPAAIDSFVTELSRMGTRVGDTAFLRATGQ